VKNAFDFDFCVLQIWRLSSSILWLVPLADAMDDIDKWLDACQVQAQENAVLFVQLQVSKSCGGMIIESDNWIAVGRWRM